MTYKRKHEHYVINYVVGDATYPIGDGPKVIAHCVNDIGKFGSGFVLSLNKRWLKVREEYFKWAAGELPSEPPFELGQVQFVQVEPELWVANIVGQHQTIRENKFPVRYDALKQGLRTVAEFCLSNNATFNAPRLGSGLAQGSWPIIAEIIENEVCKLGVDVTVYDLK